MISQKKICNHKKFEEQYICLEESCLRNSEQKLQQILFNFRLNFFLSLDCYKCLQDTHQHHECLRHIETILQEAQKNQKTFLDLFEQNLKFCQNLKTKLEKDIDQIKQKFCEWIEKQYKTSLQYIEQFELTLNEHKEKFSSAQLTPDQLKTIVEFNLYDSNLFLQQNKEIQESLEQNQNDFIQYFQVTYERLQNYELKNSQQNELTQIQISKGIIKGMQYEQCTDIGCNNQKNKFCLEESCLQRYSILECPACQTSRHCVENQQSHRQYVVSANQLWEQQNKRIDELEIFCDNQGQEIKNASTELQEQIMGYLLDNEKKLKQFKSFVVRKEKEIFEQLKKFKSQYRKDQFIIYKELFLQKNLSIIAADIMLFSENFKQMSNNFKKQYSKNTDETQTQDMEDQLPQGFFQFEVKKLQFDCQTEFNSVSKYIQNMEERIKSLNQLNKEQQIQIQQLTLQNQNDYNLYQKSNIGDEIDTISTAVSLKLNKELGSLKLDINQLGKTIKEDLIQQNEQIQKDIQKNMNQDINRFTEKIINNQKEIIEQHLQAILTTQKQLLDDLISQIKFIDNNIVSNQKQNNTQNRKIEYILSVFKEQYQIQTVKIEQNQRIFLMAIEFLSQNQPQGVLQKIKSLFKE